MNKTMIYGVQDWCKYYYNFAFAFDDLFSKLPTSCCKASCVLEGFVARPSAMAGKADAPVNG